jgi:hypothetical protein
VPVDKRGNRAFDLVVLGRRDQTRMVKATEHAVLALGRAPERELVSGSGARRHEPAANPGDLVGESLVMSEVVVPAPAGVKQLGLQHPLPGPQLTDLPTEPSIVEQPDQALGLGLGYRPTSLRTHAEAVEHDPTQTVALLVLLAEDPVLQVLRQSAVHAGPVQEERLVHEGHLDARPSRLGLQPATD